MKKIVRLLPIAFALALLNPAFAENLAPGTATGQTTTDSAQLELTLPEFIDITTQATNRSSNVTYENNYSNLKITTPILAKFQVITNIKKATNGVKLTAKAGSSEYNALRATGESDFYLVFANTSNMPDSTSIASAASASPKSEENPNAFAVHVTPKVDIVANTGATAPTPKYGTTYVDYPLTNGIYTFTYTLDQTALDSTFSTLDTDGTYQATLTLTQATL